MTLIKYIHTKAFKGNYMMARDKYQFDETGVRMFGTYTPQSVSPLHRVEQAHLHNKIQQGDLKARDTVISSCLPLVIYIAHKFRINNRHIDIEDFIQEGNIALMKAVDRWDITKGSITTVATWYIKTTFIDMINDAKYNITYPYSLSRRVSEELRKIKRVNSNNIEHISKETGLSKKKVKKLLNIAARGKKRVSLNCKDIRRSTNHTDEVETITKPCVGDLIELINHNLTGDQKTIFCLWAGINKKKIGPKEIAKSLGKSEQYVYDSIYSSKRTLSRLAKKVRNHA